MNSRCLVFIESNTSGTGPLFVRSAWQNGCRPVLLTTNPSRYPYAEEEQLLTVQVDTCDRRGLLEACSRFKVHGLAGITSSSEYYVSTAAVLARRLRLPGPRPSAIRTCRNKLSMRMCLQQADIGIPVFRQSGSIKGAISAACEIGFPVVLKPREETGSIGVRMCANVDEVASHARDLLRQRDNQRGLPMPRRILIEELVTGSEYSVETFGTTIIGITEKHLGRLPRFVEIGHDFPAVLPKAVESKVRETVGRAREALRLDWGPAHFELRISPDGPKIIEVNPRLAGGYIPELVRLATGIDLIRETIRIATGQRADLAGSCCQFASIRFLVPDQEGKLVDLQGLKDASATSGVKEVQIYCNLGSNINVRGDFRDRIGHVISEGSSAVKARTSAEAALNRIKPLVAGSSGVVVGEA
jgi:biotin carboxylase